MAPVYTEFMKIAIFGLARSGLAAFNFIQQKTQHEVFLVNLGSPESWSCWDDIKDNIPLDHCYDQEKASDLFANVDQIILSPGIPRNHSVLKAALDKGVELISEIEFAYRNSDIPVVGITGTNGKTTTTTMVGEVLKKAGKEIFIGGNIGIPYSDILLADKKYDYAIIELSSFQLESIQSFHPKVAIFLNATENHMERYDSFADYVAAKYEIFKNQTSDDIALIHPELEATNLKAKVEKIHSLDKFDYTQSKLVGEHNKMNFYCAYKVCEFLGIDNLDILFQKFINEFTGVALRLQYITTYNGLHIYNDGKSTNDAATVAAINSFSKEENLYLALGGQPRSQKTSLGESLKGLKITKVFAFGDAKDLVESALSNEYEIIKFANISEIFEYIKTQKLTGNFLFSPAFPSFDQYKNYEIRGEHFTNLTLELIK